MAKSNPLEEGIGRVQGLFHELAEATLHSVVEIVKTPVSLSIGPTEPAPLDVEARYDEIIAKVEPHPAFRALLKCVDDDQVVASRLRPWDEFLGMHEVMTRERLISSVVGRAAHLVLMGKSRADAVSQSIGSFEAIIRRGKRRVVCVASVPDLSIPEEPVRLSEEAELRKLTSEERNLIYRNSGIMPVLQERRLERGGAIVLSGHEQDYSDGLGIFPRVDSKALEQLNAALAFVQILVDDELRPERVAVLNADWLPTPFGGIGRLCSSVTLAGEVSRSTSRHIEPDERAKLPSHWSHFSIALGVPRFRRAAARYSMASQRVTDEDAVIDLCIALDALFGTSEGPVVDPLARRYAMCLGEDLADRKRQIQELKDLYSIRSGLVHGDDLDRRVKRFLKTVQQHEPKITRTDFGVVPLLARFWVKRALTFFVSNPELLNSVDEMLLRAGVNDIKWMKRMREIFDRKPEQG